MPKLSRRKSKNVLLRVSLTRGGVTLVLPLLALMSEAASAAPSIQTIPYECERGAVVWATYVNAADGSFAVVQTEGQQVATTNVPSGSGAKYAQAPNGAGYVWWTKGDEAFLAWEDVPNGTDETLLSQCQAK
ncbi:MliC family protein [Aliiroseovarius sp. Z3]|uniref:MliC family protein n=1 Tax=Aliiroseovarius sp. Z3 TaxID=2811402 RepID=UPI0023B29DF2|nr:MliC family protein [Aliiroseovarius sp. Z3]MDE9451796.1 MliC family protein [Aliiroseovarius sp. Z3]